MSVNNLVNHNFSKFLASPIALRDESVRPVRFDKLISSKDEQFVAKLDNPFYVKNLDPERSMVSKDEFQASEIELSVSSSTRGQREKSICDMDGKQRKIFGRKSKIRGLMDLRWPDSRE